MGQPRVVGILAVISLLFVVAPLAENLRLAASETTNPTRARVASVTPAGTDLLIGIGAADTIVGVSNYDDDRDGTSGKPRIGDYKTINWEKLSGLGANVLLLQYAPDRLPAYLQQQCAVMGIRILNLKLDTVDEIYTAMANLGDAVGDSARGRQAGEELRAKLAAIAQTVRGLPPVRALIVTSDEGLSLAGPGEFLDELLTIAGGQNAAASLGKPFPSVDREMISAMAPDVVIRLVPDGDKTPQVVQQGDAIWQTMPDLPAVRNHRVYVVTDWYCELPGFRIAQLAQEFAGLLHPELATTRP
jgi:iron complex transport system substrate-binding protein